LFNAHWGEQVSLGPDNTLEVSMVCEGLDGAQVREAWQPFVDWVSASAKDITIIEPFGSHVGEARSWWEVENNPSMIRDTREGVAKDQGWWRGDQAQVGMFIHGLESMWLPADLLQENQQRRIVAALIAASRHSRVQLHFNKGLAGAPSDILDSASRTATNPAVLKAFALAILAGGEAPAYPGLSRPPIDLVAARENAAAIDTATEELRKIVPNPESYVSESNYFKRDWQNSYWGVNYSKLRTIKGKYDPDGLFFVHHGVGSEDWSADGFRRLS
jgi:FAD/FMN-containing dehydrogenase